MAIPLYPNGLFNVLGKAFQALLTLEAAQLTTVPVEVRDIFKYLDTLTGASDDERQAGINVLPTMETWQADISLQQAIAAFCDLYQRAAVEKDSPQPEDSTENALSKVLAAMIEGSYYVTPPVLSATVTMDGGNEGDATLIATTLNGKAEPVQNCVAETINITVAADGRAPTFRLLGPRGGGSVLSALYTTRGSGTSLNLGALTAADSLVNGAFDTADKFANIPDGWDYYGPPANIALSTVEVQRLTFAGTPTSGQFGVRLTNEWTHQGATRMLAYNATAAALQAEINAIPGQELTTVAEGGTRPNHYFDLTFLGYGGNAPTVSVSAALSAGASLSVSTSPAGADGPYKSRALKITGDGFTEPTLRTPLILTPNQVYAVSAKVRLGAPTGDTGSSLTLALVNAGSQAVYTPAAGGNILTVPFTSLSASSWYHLTGTWRFGPEYLQPLWVDLLVEGPMEINDVLYVDELIIAPMTELYPGGPFVAAVGGRNWTIPTDKGTLVVANNRAGKIADWYGRTFGMADKRLNLPTTGANLIPDSVVGVAGADP